jgi:hypothetical protein
MALLCSKPICVGGVLEHPCRASAVLPASWAADAAAAVVAAGVAAAGVAGMLLQRAPDVVHFALLDTPYSMKQHSFS